MLTRLIELFSSESAWEGLKNPIDIDKSKIQFWSANNESKYSTYRDVYELAEKQDRLMTLALDDFCLSCIFFPLKCCSGTLDRLEL